MTWDKVVWARASIPRHAFIAWLYVQRRLPTKVHLCCFLPQSDLLFPLCTNAVEDDAHLFTTCPYAIEVWDSLTHWWPLPFGTMQTDMTMALSKYRAPKAHQQISYAIFAATIYFIGNAQNQSIFKGRYIPTRHTVATIKEQIRHRILFLHSCLCNYSKYLDLILRPYGLFCKHLYLC